MPMAMAMVAEICGDDDAKWDACRRTVSASIRARSRLWDGVLRAIANGGYWGEHTGGYESGVAAVTTIDDAPAGMATGWLARRHHRRPKVRS